MINLRSSAVAAARPADPAGRAFDRAPGAPSARCLDGDRACPPEDSGGVWGYAEKLRVLADRRGPDRDELLEWLGPDFDPASFDPDAVDAILLARFGRSKPGF